MRLFKHRGPAPEETDPSSQRAAAALARADNAMDTARDAESMARKIAASILDRVERNNLTASIEATFGRSASAGGKA